MQVIQRSNLALFLRNKCDNACSRIWICSPYIGGEKAVRRIIGISWKNNNNLDLKFLTDASTSSNYVYECLKELYSYFRFKTLPNLHAKIYIIDNECLITSSNLTNSGFAVRYEVALFFNTKEASPIISFFDDKLWNNKHSSFLKEKDIRRRVKKPFKGDFGDKGLGDNVTLPDDPEILEYSGKEDYAAWIKIDGSSKIDERSPEAFSPYKNINEHGILAFHKRPTMKKNDTVFLSYLALRNGEPDTCIYGIALVEASSRKGIDKITNHITKKDIFSDDWKIISHFNIGIGIKNLKVISTSLTNGIWLKHDILPYINLNSTKQQGHIKINQEQYDFINKKLQRKFKIFGYTVANNPQGSWWNSCIISKQKKIRKDVFIGKSDNPNL